VKAAARLSSCETSDAHLPRRFAMSHVLDRRGGLSLHRGVRLLRYQFMRSTYGQHLRSLIARRTMSSPRSPSPFRGSAENALAPRLFPMSLASSHMKQTGECIPRSRRANRAALWHSSRLVAEMLVSIFTCWEMDAVAAQGGSVAPLAREPSALQAAAFYHLWGDICRALRPHQSLKIRAGHGNSVLHMLLDHLSHIVDDNSTSQQLLVSAQEVDVDRLRLPVSAGHLDPASFLPDACAELFRDINARLLEPESIVAPLARPCLMVSEKQYRFCGNV
jgi:hypothetical protein